MPDGFVYLRHTDPTILQDIRYAGSENFTGRPVSGYLAAECILVAPAAEALRRVQAELKPARLGLKVFDCYRPARAVRAFVAWARAPEDIGLRQAFHPRIEKNKLIPAYIAGRSGHSRGAAVDLTLISLDTARKQNASHPGPCQGVDSGSEEVYALDMGTAFDCFDPLSQTFASGIQGAPRANRQRLVEAMKKHGFKNYPGEWWHFSLELEPYPGRYFDFPILPLGK